ncbi:MAG: DUF2306 domain-containing protein [Kangiellaceae bacterium]|nr:DUF2306 domain-containing protein [Kangiellaceae bacterium]
MNFVLVLHVVFGCLVLLAGFVVLITQKGTKRHKLLGRIFVVSMILTSLSAILMAYLADDFIYIGVLSFYLVFTSWLTMYRPPNTIGLLEVIAFVTIVTATYKLISTGIYAKSLPEQALYGLPFMVYFLFGCFATLCALLDIRVLVKKGLEGKERLLRHLWRMLFAFQLAMAAFLGQDIFPDLIKEIGGLWLPEMLLLFVMLYWILAIIFRKGRLISK